MQGLWLRVGDGGSAPTTTAKATLLRSDGRVRVCDLRHRPRPSDARPSDLPRRFVPASGRVDLRFSDLGLTMETG